MATTAETIIQDALDDIGALADGFTLTSGEVDKALRKLNGMLTTWRLPPSNIVIPYRTRETLTLTAAQRIYTFGSGQDFNTTAPLQIVSAFLRDSSNNDYSLGSMDVKEHDRIWLKTTPGRPTRYYFEPMYSTAKIYFDLTPQDADSFIVTSLKPISDDQFSTKDTSYTLPEEYRLAIEYNLATFLAPSYGMEVPTTIAALAAQTKGAIESNNFLNRVPILSTEDGIDRKTTGFHFESG